MAGPIIYISMLTGEFYLQSKGSCAEAGMVLKAMKKEPYNTIL